MINVKTKRSGQVQSLSNFSGLVFHFCDHMALCSRVSLQTRPRTQWRLAWAVGRGERGSSAWGPEGQGDRGGRGTSTTGEERIGTPAGWRGAAWRGRETETTGGTEEQTQVEDRVKERIFHHHRVDGSQRTADDANQEARVPYSPKRQRNTETGRSERVKDRENTSAVRLWMRTCTRMAEGACQVQLSVPAMQVTSSHVSIWFDFLASYDECTALVKFGNVASEHVKSAISVVQPQLSATQQKPSACSRKGLVLWWLIILPGWVITPVGPGKDTHGTPVPNSGKAVGGPIRRSASQQLIDTRNAKVV